MIAHLNRQDSGGMMKMYSRPQTKYPLVAKAMVVCKTWVAASKTAGVGSNPTAPAKIIIQKVKSD